VYIEFDSFDKYKIIPPRAKIFYDRVQDFLGNYQIYFFIKKFIYYLKDNISSKKNNKVKNVSAKKVDNDYNKKWLYLKGSIHQINKYIKLVNKNIKYQIIIISKSEKNKMILKKFLDEENIKFIFLDDVAKSMNIELKGFICDTHWNDDTHKNIAKLIKNIGFIK
jgi:hypothetical protein